MYDKNHGPVSSSITGICSGIWVLMLLLCFGKEQYVAWQNGEQVWKALTRALEKRQTCFPEISVSLQPKDTCRFPYIEKTHGKYRFIKGSENLDLGSERGGLCPCLPFPCLFFTPHELYLKRRARTLVINTQSANRVQKIFIFLRGGYWSGYSFKGTAEQLSAGH